MADLLVLVLLIFVFVRAIQTAIKQREVDDRIEVDESEAINIMAKLGEQSEPYLFAPIAV